MCKIHVDHFSCGHHLMTREEPCAKEQANGELCPRQENRRTDRYHKELKCDSCYAYEALLDEQAREAFERKQREPWLQ